MMHWTTRKNIEDAERNRAVAMAALAGYRITQWNTADRTLWEVSDPKGKCWAVSYSTQYAAALAVCRKMGVNL